jgi:PAN domain
MGLRHLIIASTFMVASAIPSTAFADPIESNTNRPGNDIHDGLDVRNSDECWDACTNERRCLAWTYVNPGIQARSGRCWLKDKVPARVTDRCCTSGTKFGIIDHSQ